MGYSPCMSRLSVRIRLAPPTSPRFSRSLQETRKYCACWRIFFELVAPEMPRFGRRQLIYGRFSLSGIEPVPFAHRLREEELRQDIAISAFCWYDTALQQGLTTR